jgi:hypothetical protein
MHTNNILVLEQFGFWKGIFTENAAFKLTNSGFETINQKVHVGGIFYDLVKAFDSVNHETLLTNYTFMVFKYQLKIGSDPV